MYDTQTQIEAWQIGDSRVNERQLSTVFLQRLAIKKKEKRKKNKTTKRGGEQRQSRGAREHT